MVAGPPTAKMTMGLLIVMVSGLEPAVLMKMSPPLETAFVR